MLKGAELKRMRERAGWTRSELAAAAGTTERQIYRWEDEGRLVTKTYEIALRSVLAAARFAGSKTVAEPSGETA